MSLRQAFSQADLAEELMYTVPEEIWDELGIGHPLGAQAAYIGHQLKELTDTLQLMIPEGGATR